MLDLDSVGLPLGVAILIRYDNDLIIENLTLQYQAELMPRSRSRSDSIYTK